MGAVHVGFGEFVGDHEIIAITHTNSAPVRRMIKDAKRDRRLLDYRNGRRGKSAVFLDSGHVALLAITPEAIAGRVTSLSRGQVTD